MRRAPLIGLVLVAVLGGCGGGDSDGDNPTPEGKQPLLGVTAGSLLAPAAPLEREIRVMGESGVTALRVPFYWSVAQPHKTLAGIPRGARDRHTDVDGRPTSFARTDRLVGAASRAGIALLPIVLDAPAWAAKHPGRRNSPPAGTGPYADYLKALIGRYGPSGSFWTENGDVPRRPVREWQLWNEPDHLFYWSDQPYVRDYVRLARAGRRAIKDADPGARVVMAGFADRSWQAIAAVYGAGGKGVFDIVAIHPYTLEVRNVLRLVRLARQELRKAGDGDRPLWLTEVTWSSGRVPGRPAAPFETTQPASA